ncbi:MAG: ion channel [Gammaproteobacteria bacterium]|nr:ion channel [Gammaproteobacteria bacterium]
MHRIKQIAACFSRRVDKSLVDRVEKVSTLRYILIFATAVIGFGLLYFLLTQYGHGIGRDNKVLDNATFLTGIYFSIVTISSLGYGDMHPMGISKFLACLEVLFGLVMIGVVIAKVTSYRVERIYSSDAQSRLEKFAEGFNKSQRDFTEIMTNFEATRFEEVVRTFQAQCTAFSGYFLDAANQGDYFRIVPSNAIKQVGSAVDSAFSELKSIMDSQQAMPEIPNRDLPEAIGALKRVCRLVVQDADEGTRGIFQNIEHTCTQLLEDYPVRPEESQPDQVLQDTDDPQQPSGVDDE